MENEPDVIRRQMTETRASLTETLETLENQVVETVQGATASVNETVECVKEAVKSSVESVQGSMRETVETVKDTFDIGQWVRSYPWTAVGGSVALGFVAGCLSRPRTTSVLTQQPSTSSRHAFQPNGKGAHAHPRRRHVEPRPSMWAEISKVIESETSQLKGLALATALGAIRDYAMRQVPPAVAPRLAEIIDDMTDKLAGQSIRGQVLREVEVI